MWRAGKKCGLYEGKFKEFGDVFVSTMNGEYGHNGVATDLLEKVKFDYYFACGANLMLESLVKSTNGIQGQLSFEERMGCGFGACMGCSCKTKGDNYKRICVEGPVLLSDEVIFND